MSFNNEDIEEFVKYCVHFHLDDTILQTEYAFLREGPGNPGSMSNSPRIRITFIHTLHTHFNILQFNYYILLL